MPTYEYTGPVPSEPIDYRMPNGRMYSDHMDRTYDQIVKGRVFGPRYRVVDLPGMGPMGEDANGHILQTDVVGGEHVFALENPDPSLFKEVAPDNPAAIGPPPDAPEGIRIPVEEVPPAEAAPSTPDAEV